MLFRHKSLYNAIIVLSSVLALSGAILPVFPLTSSPLVVFAQTEAEAPIKMPENLEEAKLFALEFLQGLPEALRASWQEAKGILRNTWVKWWHNSISPWLKGIWQQTIRPRADWTIEKIRAILGQEIEKRTPILKEEFKKEQEEMRKEIPQVSEGLWERFKELLQ